MCGQTSWHSYRLCLASHGKVILSLVPADTCTDCVRRQGARMCTSTTRNIIQPHSQTHRWPRTQLRNRAQKKRLERFRVTSRKRELSYEPTPGSYQLQLTLLYSSTQPAESRLRTGRISFHWPAVNVKRSSIRLAVLPRAELHQPRHVQWHQLQTAPRN